MGAVYVAKNGKSIFENIMVIRIIKIKFIIHYLY